MCGVHLCTGHSVGAVTVCGHSLPLCHRQSPYVVTCDMRSYHAPHQFLCADYSDVLSDEGLPLRPPQYWDMGTIWESMSESLGVEAGTGRESFGWLLAMGDVNKK